MAEMDTAFYGNPDPCRLAVAVADCVDGVEWVLNINDIYIFISQSYTEASQRATKRQIFLSEPQWFSAILNVKARLFYFYQC